MSNFLLACSQKLKEKLDTFSFNFWPVTFNYSPHRFTIFEDKEWFVENFWKTAAVELSEYVNDFPEGETYFVNFLREPVDPTGDEEEDFSTEAPKVYEELPS